MSNQLVTPSVPTRAAPQQGSGGVAYRRLMVADIQRAVCERHKLPTRIMRQRSPRGVITKETRPIVHARQEAMLLAFRLTGHSKSRLAHFFGLQDHSSVIAAIRNAEERMASDLVARADIQTMIDELTA